MKTTTKRAGKRIKKLLSVYGRSHARRMIRQLYRSYLSSPETQTDDPATRTEYFDFYRTLKKAF